MKLLFIVDGRSPIALNWMRHFVETGHEVHLASTYPCQPELKLASLTIIPTAFGDIAGGSRQAAGRGVRGVLRKLVPVGLRTAVRQRFGPLTLAKAATHLRILMDDLQPQLAHAMRIPFEGMLLAQAVLTQGKSPPPPIIISVWGNDFTLHAPANPQMSLLTRQVLHTTSALHTDCQRDQNLAREWGFERGKPAIVLPGNGGIDLNVFYFPRPLPPSQPSFGRGVREIPPKVINPRGIRVYVRNDTFFAAIPAVLAKQPDTRFVCPNMAGEALAEGLVRRFNIGHAVELLPRLTQPQMAEQFRQAQVVASITEHDGTPNTLLEAMACGCYPVVGDVESLREWITPSINGSLVPPGDAAALAQAILQALDSPALRQSTAAHNIQLIRQRAEYQQCMGQAETFYRRLAS